MVPTKPIEFGRFRVERLRFYWLSIFYAIKYILQRVTTHRSMYAWCPLWKLPTTRNGVLSVSGRNYIFNRLRSLWPTWRLMCAFVFDSITWVFNFKKVSKTRRECGGKYNFTCPEKLFETVKNAGKLFHRAGGNYVD